MKFGKVLRETVRTRMPAWADYMVQYKALKQLLNQLEAQAKEEEAGRGACSSQLAKCSSSDSAGTLDPSCVGSRAMLLAMAWGRRAQKTAAGWRASPPSFRSSRHPPAFCTGCVAVSASSCHLLGAAPPRAQMTRRRWRTTRSRDSRSG